MKNSKKLQSKWYMNYLHTFDYYCRLRETGVPAQIAFARVKNFARQQPEFCQECKDYLTTTMFMIIRRKFGRPNRAPQYIQAYYKRKADVIGW